MTPQGKITEAMAAHSYLLAKLCPEDEARLKRIEEMLAKLLAEPAEKDPNQ